MDQLKIQTSAEVALRKIWKQAIAKDSLEAKDSEFRSKELMDGRLWVYHPGEKYEMGDILDSWIGRKPGKKTWYELEYYPELVVTKEDEEELVRKDLEKVLLLCRKRLPKHRDRSKGIWKTVGDILRDGDIENSSKDTLKEDRRRGTTIIFDIGRLNKDCRGRLSFFPEGSSKAYYCMVVIDPQSCKEFWENIRGSSLNEINEKAKHSYIW